MANRLSPDWHYRCRECGRELRHLARIDAWLDDTNRRVCKATGRGRVPYESSTPRDKTGAN